MREIANRWAEKGEYVYSTAISQPYDPYYLFRVWRRTIDLLIHCENDKSGTETEKGICNGEEGRNDKADEPSDRGRRDGEM